MNDTDMRAIAAGLGQGWTADGEFLDGPDDARLRVATRAYDLSPGRVRVLTILPDGWRDHAPRSYEKDQPQDPGDITMLAAKSPATMAREIRRRLLPAWSAYLDVTRQRKARSDARRDEVASVGDRLVAMAPGARWVWSNGDAGRGYTRATDPANFPDRSEIDIGKHGDVVRANVKIMRGSARVELEITDREALSALVAWIAVWRRAGEAPGDDPGDYRLRRVREHLETARDAAQTAGDGHIREGLDEAIGYVQDEIEGGA